MEDSYLDAISEIVPGFLYIGGGNCYSNTAFFLERPACYVLNCSGVLALLDACLLLNGCVARGRAQAHMLRHQVPAGEGV